MSKLKHTAVILILAVAVSLICAAAYAEGYAAFVSDKAVNVYADKDMTQAPTTLEKWSVLMVDSVDNDVAAVTYRKKTGYCKLDGLTPVSDVAEEATISVAGAYVYAEPSEFSACKAVKKDTVVNKIATSGDWSLIEKNGTGAYIRNENLSDPNAQPTPDPDDASFEAVVTTDKLAVYESAKAGSKKLGTLKKGTVVTVKNYNTKWAYIEKDGKLGYCDVTGLKKNDGNDDPSDDTVIPATVSAERVNVFKNPTTASKKLGVLKYGTVVNVVKYNKKWAYIEKNGYYGYCKLKALTKKPLGNDPDPDFNGDDDYRKRYPNVQFTATVVYEYAPVYDEPSTDGLNIKLNAGLSVDVYAYSKTWAYIGINNARGFILKKYLNASTYEELSSGDTGTEVLKLQTALEKGGYFDGIPAGTFSTLTSAAVKRFQAEIGMSQTGTADENTLRVLYGGYAPEATLLDTELKSGDNNTAVERLQTRLFYLGYLSKTDSIDSNYGTTTVAAVKLFEAEAELTQDGVADTVMMHALYSNDAPTLPSSKNPADYTPGGSTPTNPGVTKMPAGLGSTQSTLPDNPTKEEKIEYVIYTAQNQLGKPYIYGTAGPNSFDCSGLTCYCFKKIGLTLGRSAYAQGYENNTGTKIEGAENLQRGDIMCFNTISDSDLSDHVGIYIGKGYFIHASSGTSNGKQVVVSNISSGYYQRVFSWGRRPLN